jgi:hypothetical protein
MSLTFRIPRDTLIIPFPMRKEGFSLCYLRILLFLIRHHYRSLDCGEVLPESN